VARQRTNPPPGGPVEPVNGFLRQDRVSGERHGVDLDGEAAAAARCLRAGLLVGAGWGKVARAV